MPCVQTSRHFELTQNEFQAVHVVRMGMGQDDQVQPADPPVPEKRRQHPAAHIEPVVIGPAAVDQYVPGPES